MLFHFCTSIVYPFYLLCTSFPLFFFQHHVCTFFVCFVPFPIFSFLNIIFVPSFFSFFFVMSQRERRNPRGASDSPFGKVQAGVLGGPERGKDQHHHAIHVRQLRQELPGDHRDRLPVQDDVRNVYSMNTVVETVAEHGTIFCCCWPPWSVNFSRRRGGGVYVDAPAVFAARRMEGCAFATAAAAAGSSGGLDVCSVGRGADVVEM